MVLHTENAAQSVGLQTSTILTCLCEGRRILSCLPFILACAAANTCENYCQLWQLFLWRGTSVYIKSGWDLQTHSQRPWNSHQMVKLPSWLKHKLLSQKWERLCLTNTHLSQAEVCNIRVQGNPCNCWQMDLHLKSLPPLLAPLMFWKVNKKNYLLHHTSKKQEH